jgi:hypothetical protein
MAPNKGWWLVRRGEEYVRLTRGHRPRRYRYFAALRQVVERSAPRRRFYHFYEGNLVLRLTFGRRTINKFNVLLHLTPELYLDRDACASYLRAKRREWRKVHATAVALVNLGMGRNAALEEARKWACLTTL